MGPHVDGTGKSSRHIPAVAWPGGTGGLERHFLPAGCGKPCEEPKSLWLHPPAAVLQVPAGPAFGVSM